MPRVTKQEEYNNTFKKLTAFIFAVNESCPDVMFLEAVLAEDLHTAVLFMEAKQYYKFEYHSRTKKVNYARRNDARRGA